MNQVLTIANFKDWTVESYTADQFDQTIGHVEANWVLDDDTSVTQTNNCLPSFFYSDFNPFNKTIEVELSVGDQDDDFIGFALNFQPGDTTNPSPDILVVDWMGKEESGKRTIRMQLSRITNLPSFLGFTHLDSIQKAMTLSETTWEKNRVYKFKFVYTESLIQVFVDGSEEFKVEGTFTDGRFACYACGQPGVTFRNVAVEGESPSWEQTSHTVLSLDHSLSFGDSVGIDGDVAIIGAPTGELESEAYIYKLEEGEWKQQQKLQTSDSQSNTVLGYATGFGFSVDISGDVAIVGASNLGVAYIFKLEEGEWKQQKKLQWDNSSVPYFGSSVAISGDVAIVGVVYGDAAYIFKLEGGEWKQQQKLQPSDLPSNAQFGYFVDISGDVAVVGAPQGDAAYIFKLEGGEWKQQQKLQASDWQGKAQFGYSVAIDGDVAIIGAISIQAVYIFKLEKGTWNQQQKLQQPDLPSAHQVGYGNQFGQFVDLDGDVAIISATNAYVPGKPYVGVAFVYKLEEGTWKQKQKLEGDDFPKGGYFARDVNISRGIAIVGGFNTDTVYIFQAED
ncbi:MAG: hypothetical protein F6K21_30435 [Symploca sp. SIO2D2]|nr:hypothetical protein [Symploca sp. SIO2D2]